MKGICSECGGTGKVPLGEHLVTREMARDAGDLSLEGQVYEIEYKPCNQCNGSGRCGISVDELEEE